MDDPTLVRTVCRIAGYWLTRPQAADTPAGVRRWWLDMPVHELHVQHALDALVSAGIAQASAEPGGRGAQGRMLYRLAVAPDALRAWMSEHCRPGANT